MSPRIRFISIVSERPDPLAEFYITYFHMKELGRDEQGVALTDGFYNVSIVERQGEQEIGFSHFGLEIDDIHEVEARLEKFALNAEIQSETGGLLHGEYRVFDPNGIAVSLSTRHFNVPGEDRRPPEIRHVAMMVPNNEDVLQFYRNVFGFRETNSSFRNRQLGDVSRHAADGATALAILAEPAVIKEPEGSSLKWGVNHFGFLVMNIQNFLASLPEGCLSKRPDDRPMAEYRASDPDGNAIDISQFKGYEIDQGVWARTG